VDPSTEEDPNRTIILVGHDVEADINFLLTIGYNLRNLSTLTETVDTSCMWRYLKQEDNPRNLASILAESGIVAWNLHNAGNDAVYTLQAMLAIAINDMVDRQTQKEIKDQEKRTTVDE
jgi:DNA polymerase III alpha subunit (gram-positive type)